MQLKFQATPGCAGAMFAQNHASSFTSRYGHAFPKVLPRFHSNPSVLKSPVSSAFHYSAGVGIPALFSQGFFNQRQRGSTHRGFTLVELLVVITLVAILAVGVMLSADGVEDDANDKLTRVEMSEVRKALLQFKRDVGHFPHPEDVSPLEDIPKKSLELLIACEESQDAGCKPWNRDAARGWNGPYILTEGLTDGWGQRYQLYDADTVSARIVSFGPDKTFGTAGDGATECETSTSSDDIVLCLLK